MTEAHINHLLKVVVTLDLPVHNLKSGHPCPGGNMPPSTVKKQKGAIFGPCNSIAECVKYRILLEIKAPDPNDGAFSWSLVSL